MMRSARPRSSAGQSNRLLSGRSEVRILPGSPMLFQSTIFEDAATLTNRPDFSLETAAGVAPVCGVDEAGRGPIAGPVVAAAVVLDPNRVPQGIDDSKRIAASHRSKLASQLQSCAGVSIGVASVEEIDDLNILGATMLAMRRAIHGLAHKPALALIDGNRVPPDLVCEAIAVVKGDRRSLSIAAASIVAKVHRDSLLAALSLDHPGYGWDHNAGYPTAEHRQALVRLGATRHHRRSFAPVREVLANNALASLNSP